jgi:hypothetical protein
MLSSLQTAWVTTKRTVLLLLQMNALSKINMHLCVCVYLCVHVCVSACVSVTVCVHGREGVEEARQEKIKHIFRFPSIQ